MRFTRREFIHAGCAIATAASLSPAIAGINNPGSRGGSSFNGGKSQVNLNFLQTAGDYPFLNCLKTAQAWGFINNASAPVTPDLLDADGYPTSIINTGVNTVFYVPTQAARPGNYVITWDGTGTIFCGMSNTLVSGSKTSSGGAGAGRYVFSTVDFRFSVGISSIGSPRITNLKVFHVDDEISINAGQVFGAKFKQRLQEANFGVIRFLNWQLGNTSQATTWLTRRAISYVWYSGAERRPSIYGGVTTNIANAYSVAIPPIHTSTGLAWNNGDSPNQGDTISIVFNASATQSGTCSLQVGTGGTSSAINILNQFTNPLSVGSNSYPIAGTFQSMATLVFDATLNAWIKQGGDAALGSVGLNNGVPPELMVQLCKEVGAHPYFVAPAYAVDPMTDFFPSLAAYCKSYTPSNAPWMVPRFEGPNELWNGGAGGAYDTGYANSKANAYHAADPTHWTATGDYQNWYGKIMSTIGQAINAVYGGTVGTQSAYQVICGVQTGTGNTFPGGTNASNPRLSSAAYISQSAPPQVGYTQTAASGWVTHICCAQYIGPSDTGTGAETTLAASFAGKAFVASISSDVMTVTALNASNSAAFAVGDTIFGTEIYAVGGGIPAGVTIASFGTGVGGTGTYNLSSSGLTTASQNMTGATDLTAPNTFADTTNSGGGAFTVFACLTLYTNWKAWAQSFGINKMCGYEGGYSPDYTSAGNSLVDMLRGASKLNSNLSAFTTTNYNNFVGLTGGGFTSEFPSCFQFSGNPNIVGRSQDAWSVLEDIYQTPNPPQWSAFIAFNH